MSLIFGHRGSSEIYPENTMLAFNKAIEEGADGIEADIWKSSDGEYVIIHDNTVDRTTDYNGPVSSFTLNQLVNMDAGSWKGSEFANREDTKIPSLELFLETFKHQDIKLIIQIKLGLIDCKNIINIIKNKGILDQCIIFTNKNYLGELKVYEPNAFIMNDGTTNDPILLLQQAVNENWDAISTGGDYYNIDNVNLAKSMGIKTQVSYLTGNYIQQVTKFRDMGIDFILGNNVKKMVNAVSFTQNDSCEIYVKINGSLVKSELFYKSNGYWEPRELIKK